MSHRLFHSFFLLPLIASVALAASPEAAPAGTEPKTASERSDAEVEARSSALDVAGAFSNDGFKIRDSHWFGTLKAGESRLVQVNLYTGNEYWFVGAGGGETGKIRLTLFNEDGQPVAAEMYENGHRTAAGFAPVASGPYYVKVEAVAESGSSAVCLLYCYK